MLCSYHWPGEFSRGQQSCLNRSFGGGRRGHVVVYALFFPVITSFLSSCHRRTSVSSNPGKLLYSSSPMSADNGIFQGVGGRVSSEIFRPFLAGTLHPPSPPLLHTPPLLEGGSGWGWGCIKFTTSPKLFEPYVAQTHDGKLL